MIKLMGSLSMVIGASLYGRYFKHLDITETFWYLCWFMLAEESCNLFFVLRLNLKIGIPDFYWIAFMKLTL